ncbi:hypothetical protein TcYC6_0008240 [Trypanosoma cruzi]|nr:hypothetical protein TcYC6_0008240 [Trypanosoma cruzi]RNC55463.1 hypothetical protein TcCL_ESM07060 [Trypanosoma cruzi]
MTDQAIPVTFHTYPRAHHRHGKIPQVCTWNVGALDDAALGFVARYGPLFLCVQEVCGVSLESTIFTETFSTAACIYATSRRTVEAREHTSTVLDHLATHIVDVPFFLARSTEECTTRMQFVFGDCGVSENEACDA